MSYDEDGWIPLCRELLELYGSSIPVKSLESAENTIWSGEPEWGALIVLECLQENGTFVDSDLLERLAGWFLYEDDSFEPPDEDLVEVFGLLRERAANAA